MLVILGLCWSVLISGFSFAQTSAPITIAAAANLNGTLDTIVSMYQQKTRQEIKVVYGSSGNFYQQITQGAPFDLFLSANADFAERLEKGGLSQEASKVYARGRLVLWVSKDASIKLDPSLLEFKSALESGRIQKVAIANPKLAPYGLAAEQSFQRYGIYDVVKPRLVLAGDVGQTALFLSSGAATAGIIPFSLVGHLNDLQGGTFMVIPEKNHDPIIQKMILLKKASTEAKNFYNFITSETAQKIWVANGYN